MSEPSRSCECWILFHIENSFGTWTQSSLNDANKMSIMLFWVNDWLWLAIELWSCQLVLKHSKTVTHPMHHWTTPSKVHVSRWWRHLFFEHARRKPTVEARVRPWCMGSCLILTGCIILASSSGRNAVLVIVCLLPAFVRAVRAILGKACVMKSESLWY